MICRTFDGYLSDSTISSGERLTFGHAFFPEAGCGGGEGIVVSAGVGKGLSSGTGVEVVFGCFRFDLLFGVPLGAGGDESFFFPAGGGGAKKKKLRRPRLRLL